MKYATPQTAKGAHPGAFRVSAPCKSVRALAWDALKALGMRFMTAPPATYYEMLEGRLPEHGEPLAELQARGILLDGSSAAGERRLLLQIFSGTLLGPVFFELIQRTDDADFGVSNVIANIGSFSTAR